MKQARTDLMNLIGSGAGAAQMEQLVLIATIAIGFAAAAVPLGRLLLELHEAIELVLMLPIP